MVHLYGQPVPCWPLCLTKDKLSILIPVKNMDPDVEKILLLCTIHLLFALPQVSIRRDLGHYLKEGRCDCYYWFSTAWFFRSVFRARLRERSQSHFHHFPALLKSQGPHVVHTALWCKTHVHVETSQLQLWSSWDKSTSRVRILPSNASASKKFSFFCSGLIGFSLGVFWFFLMGKKKERHVFGAELVWRAV